MKLVLKPVLVLTTVGADFDSRVLANALVELRLAACVNILERVQSIPWLLDSAP